MTKPAIATAPLEEVQARDGEKVHQVLRERILRLDLRPGSVIDEATLAAQLSVSRTPVREAIIRLLSEGLAIRDGRTARVAPLDFDEVPKIYDALVVSSRMIQRLAAENRTPADITAIRAALKGFETFAHTGDGVQLQDANVEFHMAIARAAANRYFIEFYERTLLASSRLARACFSNRNLAVSAGTRPDEELAAHIKETARQHRLMFEAIEARDIEVSDRLAVEHQRLSFSRLQKTIFTVSDAIAANPRLGTNWYVPPSK